MTLPAALLTTIHQSALKLFSRMRRIRRDLHQHPELSGYESWTARYLADELDQIGLDVKTGIGGLGLYADLVADPGAPLVALRVDIDALPISETNEVPYRSQNPAVMHACGHDVHSAIGVGTAAVLAAISEQLSGNIRFIFQPEEEEITGALRMIRAGVLRDPVPRAIFGFHVAPLPVGQIAWTDDLFLAGFDHYLATITPKQGYQTTISHLDAIAARCCQVIQGFNKFQLPENWEDMQTFWQMMAAGPYDLRHFTIYEASLNEEEPSAWHGQFGVGVKAANHHLRLAAAGRIRASLERIGRLTHTRIRLERADSMLDMRNDPQLVRSTLFALENALGKNNLLHLQAAFPFNCEDFAFYTEIVPGAMYWLGGANPALGKYAMLHTPDFDVDEGCLITGTTAMAALLVSFLNQIPSS